VFDTHQPIIGRWARERPAHLREVLRFAVLSARQPLYNLPADMEQAHRGGPDAMSVLFGWKHRAWIACEDHEQAIFTQCLDIWEHSSRLDFELVLYLAGLPGLGLAKAGFVAQLAFGVSGCLDTHNLRRFGIDPNTFAHIKQRKTLAARRRMTERYCTIIDWCGGTGALWDSWCHYVASDSLMKRAYRNAEHVSELHCIALDLPTC